MRVAAVAVDFVDDDYRGESERKRLLGDKARLGHRAFESVDYQENAVDGSEHALHLAAEVRVPRRVDDVDVVPFIIDARVLGKNRDAAFPFDGAGVHDSFVHLFAFVERSALFENLVDERRFAVVDMRDDRNVSDFVLIHFGFPVLGTSGYSFIWREI